MLPRLLLNISTKYQKIVQNNITSPIFAQRAKTKVGEGQSSPQDQEEGSRSRPYLLVYFKPGPFWQRIVTGSDQFHTDLQCHFNGEEITLWTKSNLFNIGCISNLIQIV